jgi:hypothetical protein
MQNQHVRLIGHAEKRGSFAPNKIIQPCCHAALQIDWRASHCNAQNPIMKN